MKKSNLIIATLLVVHHLDCLANCVTTIEVSGTSSSLVSSNNSNECINISESASFVVTNNSAIEAFGASSEITNRGILASSDWGLIFSSDLKSFYNYGSISSSGLYSLILIFGGDVTEVFNFNSIQSSQDGSELLSGYGGNSVSVLNSGLMQTSGDYAMVVNSAFNFTEFVNNGNVITSGAGANVFTNYGNFSISNNASGLISTSGMEAHAFYIFAPSVIRPQSTLINYGTISTSGNGAYGIYIRVGNYITVENYGNILTSGASAIGMVSLDPYIFVNNKGNLQTAGNGVSVVVLNGPNSEFINQGNVSSVGFGSIGIRLMGNFAYLENSGTIATSGQNSHAVSVETSNALIYNNGSVISSYSTSRSFNISGNNNTVNLNRGSIIIGDIFAGSSTTGNRLNINLGSGVSYAYSVTGPWTVSDLDNRPMVTGSAYAAGIGAQETASEMLYQRTSTITSALDRRNRSYNANYLENQPYWLDVHYADATRHSGGNYSTQTAFANHNFGMTAGFKLAEQYTPLELVVSVEQSKLNIDSGNQKIDSTSLMAGLSVPNLAEVLGTRLSAKAMVGYADHDGDRKVMTNSLLYDGSRQIKSDYKSHAVLLGAALNKPFELSDHLVADVLIGVDYTAQRVRAYSEEDYFAWNGRTLSQVQSRVQLGLEGFFFNNRGSVFGQLGAEHRDLIGGATQGYSINGTSVSFNTNNKNDTYLTAQMGMKIQLDKRIQLFGLVNKLHSSDSVDSLSGNIGLRADF